jgi:orotidine-5'-phosphate decarboxylase
MNAFQKKLLREADKKKSRVILSLDMAVAVNNKKDQEVLLERAFEVCKGVRKYIVGVKVTRSFADAVGIRSFKPLMKVAKVPFIADYKMADISPVCLWTAKNSFTAGFEAMTVHAFIGREPISALLKEFPDKGVLVVTDMAHPSASEFMLPVFDRACALAKDVGATGIVMPRVYADKIPKIREIIGKDTWIFVAGMGSPESFYGRGLRAGADFEVIGRTIRRAKDPEERMIEILEEIRTGKFQTYEVGTEEEVWHP